MLDNSEDVINVFPAYLHHDQDLEPLATSLPTKKKLNMKNIGTKSINMSDIKAYLAMFSTTIDKMFLSYYSISLWYPLELGTFLISEDPPP